MQTSPSPGPSIPLLGRHRTLLLEITETLLLAALIFFATRLVVQNFRVEGPSMLPTLENAQFLLVNKLAYVASDPARGDIVVFRSPRNPSEDLVKRIVALPSETVEVLDGSVIVNGQRLDESSYLQARVGADMRPQSIPPGSYFVMGDNRAQSRDSRVIGPIPHDSIVGQVWLVYWPPAGFGLLENRPPELLPAPRQITRAA